MVNSMNNEIVTTVCKKGQGNSLGTLMRQIAYNTIPCWRPIGYEIEGKDVSLLHADGTVVQDMVEFAYNLGELQFSEAVEIRDDFIKQKYTFKRCLNSDSMSKEQKLSCTTPNKDILDILGDSSLTIVIYFRKTSGMQDVEHNVNFLESKGENVDAIKVMASTHSVIKAFTIKVEEKSLDEETLTLNVTSKTEDTRAIIKQSAKEAVASLNGLIGNLD